jgi:hypothetical protein
MDPIERTIMPRHRLPQLVLLALLLSASLAAATPPRIASTAPEHQPATVDLEPLWTRGGEDDEEVLFGHPRDVVADAEGRVMVLDSQLCQIVVFSPDGELIGILGREGEGPGEFRRPAGLITLSDGSVAAGSTFGARFELLGLDGVPRGTLRLGGDGPREGAFVLYRAQFRAGTLVAATATSAFDQSTGQMHRVQQLATYDLDGTHRADLCSAALEMDFTGVRPIVEETLLRDFLIVSAIGPDGLVYVPHGRDAYLIDVVDPDGTLVQQIGRPDFVAPPRSEREDRRLAALHDTWERNAGIDIRFETADTERAVQSVFVDERGHLFVRHAGSNRDLPAGAFLRLDEFAPDGEWLREVVVQGVGDPQLDTLIWLGPGRVAVQRGGALIALERWSDAAVFWEDEAEVVPELVVCAWRP